MGEPLTSYGAQGSRSFRHRGQLPEFAAGDRTERQQTRHLLSIAADRFARGCFDAEAERVWPDQPLIQQRPHQRVGDARNVALGTGAIDQHVGTELAAAPPRGAYSVIKLLSLQAIDCIRRARTESCLY